MKVIHIMTHNTEGEYTMLGNTSILVAFLSVLKWKSYGFTTKLYVDNHYKQYFSELGLLELYDEVDDNYFIDDNLYNKYNIDKRYFWAFSKLFVYLNEEEPFIMSDMDFIPLKDYHNELDNKCFAYYKETLLMNKEVYPNANELPIAEGYNFPNWLTWKEKPYNMCISYINDNELKDLYVNEAIRYASNNTDNEFNPEEVEQRFVPRMVFVEQRLLSECAKHLNINIKELKTRYEYIFNEKAIHLFNYKNVDFGENNPYNWILFFLDKLNKEFPEVYSKLIQLEEYSEYKTKIESEGFVYETPKMLKRTNW